MGIQAVKTALIRYDKDTLTRRSKMYTRKIFLNNFFLFFAIFTILISFAFSAFAEDPRTDPLNYGSGITVDGCRDDWNKATDIYRNMWRRGIVPNKSSDYEKDDLGDIFLRYDCSTGRLYVLWDTNSKAESGIEEGSDQAFIKIMKTNGSNVGTIIVDAGDSLSNDPDRMWRWITRYVYDDQHTDHWADGFEAVGKIGPGTHEITFHTNAKYIAEVNPDTTLVLTNGEWGTIGYKSCTVVIDCDNPPSSEDPYDYGDNPKVYGNCYHPINSTIIRMGERVDGDSNTAYSIDSQGDDTTDPTYSDDEDGVEFLNSSGETIAEQEGKLYLAKGQNYQLRFTVSNKTTQDAELHGWIDWNADGDFDDTDEKVATIALIEHSDSENRIYTISDQVPSTVRTDGTPVYARFRFQTINPYGGSLTPPPGQPGMASKFDPPAINNPPLVMEDVGSEQEEGNLGEIEDYVLYGNEPPVSVNLSSFNALVENNIIYISWTTESELNHCGYNLYRSENESGSFSKINSQLIINENKSETTSKYYEYHDYPNISGTYYYKLEDISLDGKSTFHGPISVTLLTKVSDHSATPNEYELSSNYPNPFNPTTTLKYALPNTSDVELNIYNIQGTLIRTLVNGLENAGEHQVVWDATDDYGHAVPSGIYIYQLKAGEFSDIGRMTLLK